MSDYPPALAWLPDLAASIGRASLGSLVSWRAVGDADPLKWFLVLTFDHNLRPDEPPMLRTMLKYWAEANECAYRRSEYDKREMRVLIYLRGLHPESRVNPFLETKHARRRIG